jgi:alkanesulfonate monooxygenase SsuD/methylene tetrahydromethanopterin reductase-like flavin-dependent oxidoreductase (luciferase family)
MKFYVSSAFLDTREIVEIAKAADELGYDGIGIPDHIVKSGDVENPVPLHQGRVAALASVHRMA